MESPAYLMMKYFNHNNSVEILCGENSYLKLPKRINECYKRILFICSNGELHNHYVLKKVKNTLIKSSPIISGILSISQRPTTSTIRLGVKKCVNNNVDCIIALGEKPTIDTAKLIALEAKKTIAPLPVIIIPTSFKSSEITNYAAILDENTKENHYLKCDFPLLAIIDPTLTANTPVKLAIWDAMHVLDDIFNFYFNSSTENELENYYCELLIQRTMGAVEDMIQNPHNINTKDNLMWCALISSVIFPQHPNHHNVSMIAKSFSSCFNIPHGLV